jgi:hypothetical protein
VPVCRDKKNRLQGLISVEIGSFFVDKGDNYRYNNRYAVYFCGGGQNMENIGEKIMRARKTKA